MNDPVFPYAETSENVVISAIMQKPEILMETFFSSELFSFPRTLIFERLSQLATDHAKISWDMMLASFTLAELSDIGGRESLQEILFFTNAPEDWSFAYKFVLESYQRRVRMQFALHDIRSCSNIEEPFNPDALEKFDYRIGEIKPDEDSRTMFKRTVEKIFQSDASDLIHLSGIKALDQVLGYVHPGNVIVIGSQTSMGKSAMAHNIAVHASLNGYHKKVALYSMEMNQDEVCERILSNVCAIHMRQIRDRELDSEARKKMDDFIDTNMKPGDYPIRVIDESIQDVDQIRSRCLKIKRKTGLDLVIVDYLQLISPRNIRGSNRQSELAEISRKLKVMANDLKVVVVSLSQLNEQDQLRESRAIGHDADIVLYIVNPDGDKQLSSLREIHIIKARHGTRTKIEVDFYPPYVSFSDRPKQ